ncbi:DUF2691 family protein [Neobacillus sp. LXY-1]|uniref:DUF2691 family protein n=1 Tax=Neobacillus sp. LXY-1 TaxID=3379133 RepID=UPI003EE3B5F5
MRGFSFKVPNSSERVLEEILKPIDITEYNWRIGYGESYVMNESELGKKPFPTDVKEIDGTTLKELISKEGYLVIFADLKAFPKGKIVTDINTYEEFIISDCQLVLLLSDCDYCEIYCKDKNNLERMTQHAKICVFEEVEYTTEENDGRKGCQYVR